LSRVYSDIIIAPVAQKDSIFRVAEVAAHRHHQKWVTPLGI
jgi:hypothetical protein